MSNMNHERVLSVHHWNDTLFSFNDTLFSFKCTRDPGLRFENGQFVMIGLQQPNGRPLMRAYSIASPNWEEHLEFFSIKVPDGPLTSQLQHLKEGDEIIISKKPTGTLVLDDLKPGKHLYLLSTGTGLAPFMSVIQDPETYERFEKVILCHGVRYVNEVAYREFITEHLPQNEFFGEALREKLIYYPTVTREPFENEGRLTDPHRKSPRCRKAARAFSFLAFLFGGDDFQHADHARLRVVPAHIQVPELRAVLTRRRGCLVSRARVLGQTLLDQLDQWLAKALGVRLGLLQGIIRPLHGNQLWCRAGDVVDGRGHAVGVGHVGLDIEDRRAVQQVDTRDPQPMAFDLVQPDHRLTDAVGSMRRARGKHTDGFVAPQARWPDLESRLVLQGLVEQEQQPDMADLLQPLDGIALVERCHQFQYTPCRRRQLWLAGDGELWRTSP